MYVNLQERNINVGFKTVEYENSALIISERVESGKNLWYALQWE